MAALAERNGDIWASAASMASRRVLARDQADRVLSLGNAAGRGGGHANESAPSQRKIEFQTIAAGDDGAMQIGQAGELDHGIDDLLPV